MEVMIKELMPPADFPGIPAKQRVPLAMRGAQSWATALRAAKTMPGLPRRPSTWKIGPGTIPWPLDNDMLDFDTEAREWAMASELQIAAQWGMKFDKTLDKHIGRSRAPRFVLRKLYHKEKLFEEGATKLARTAAIAVGRSRDRWRQVLRLDEHQ